MTKVFPVILSGGSGTRLWPLSRQARPKQFLTLLGEQSLLQDTALRVSADAAAGLFGPLMLIGNAAHRHDAEAQLAALGVTPALHILEPQGRNTAPAAAIAALAVQAQAPDAVLALLAADHFIADKTAFLEAATKAAADAKEGRIVTFGIVPGTPETGYGYIKRGETAFDTGAYPVAEFVEKPDRATAESYLRSGAYLWNSGMFLTRADVLLAEMRQHCPAIMAAAETAFTKGQRQGHVLALDPVSFAACPSDSIDYALMEHTARASVLPARMGWSDVGSWATLWELAQKDPAGNSARGLVYAEDSRSSYIRAEGRLVATVGVENLVIVETSDAVLVARRDRVQEIKAIIERLKKDGRAER